MSRQRAFLVELEGIHEGVAGGLEIAGGQGAFSFADQAIDRFLHLLRLAVPRGLTAGVTAGLSWVVTGGVAVPPLIHSLTHRSAAQIRPLWFDDVTGGRLLHLAESSRHRGRSGYRRKLGGRTRAQPAYDKTNYTIHGLAPSLRTKNDSSLWTSRDENSSPRQSVDGMREWIVQDVVWVGYGCG